MFYVAQFQRICMRYVSHLSLCELDEKKPYKKYDHAAITPNQVGQIGTNLLFGQVAKAHELDWTGCVRISIVA